MNADTILEDKAESLSDYCQSLSDLTPLHEFEETYTIAKRTARTWDSYGRFLPSELLSSEFRRTRIECGRFFVYSYSILEDIYPKLLAQEFAEEPKTAENYLSGVSKAELEELLYHFGIIDGQTKHELEKIRSRRITFAHGHDPQENYFGEIDLQSAIDRRYNVISEFIERVYHRPLPDIANYISKCYEVPVTRHNRIQDYTTAQLLKSHRDLEPEMAAFPSDFQEEVRESFEEIVVPLPRDIEEELEQRGYDSTNATEVVPPARRPLELKPTEYSVDDTYIDITLTNSQELIGWDHEFEIVFDIELLDYYAANGKETETPPKQATAILLMNGSVVDIERLSPVPKVGARREVNLSYDLDEEFYATPTIQLRYGVVIEQEQRFHMSMRDESVLNIVPVSQEFTEAKYRLLTQIDNYSSLDEMVDTLRIVRSKLSYVEEAIRQSDSSEDIIDPVDLDQLDKADIQSEVGRTLDHIEHYNQAFGLNEEKTNN